MKLRQKQFLDTYLGLPLVFLHTLLARLLGFILRRPHGLREPPKEICIIKLLGFGSILMASDALYSLKLKYPDAVFSIVCGRGIEEPVRSLHLFEKVYVINDFSFVSLISSTISYVSHFMFRRNVWIADLEIYSKLTSILSLWTFALNRFGFYFNDVAFRYNLYTHKVYFNTAINVEENYEQMVMAMGVTDILQFSIPGFPPREQGKTYSYIAINNTCSELAQERKLTSEQLAALCRWVSEHTQYRVALLGAPSDRSDNDHFIQHYFDGQEERPVNVAGQYVFGDYYRFLYDHCAIMITIDSAPLHIANKLNIPNISIWGPTSPQSRIDLNNGNAYIYLGVKCSPCTHFVDILPCGGDNFCIKNISLDMMSHAIQNILKSA